MDFQLTEEQQMIVDSLRKYAGNEVTPVAQEYRDRLIPKEKMLDIQQRLLAVIEPAGEQQDRS